MLKSKFWIESKNFEEQKLNWLPEQEQKLNWLPEQEPKLRTAAPVPVPAQVLAPIHLSNFFEKKIMVWRKFVNFYKFNLTS
jgi:hypothetical protein